MHNYYKLAQSIRQHKSYRNKIILLTVIISLFSSGTYHYALNSHIVHIIVVE